MINIQMCTLVKILLVALFGCLVVGIAIKDRRFYDQQGRQILFHGPNVVVKVPPYLPKLTGEFNKMNSFSQQDMKNLKEWGFNGIRLGMMWAGVQPTKDTYNETYLQEMLNLVNKAGKDYGIYTLIDFHQDLIAEKFCGDGVPTWLIDEIHGYKTFPLPLGKHIKLNSSGLPDWSACNQNGWGAYYFTDDVGHVFNQLYDSTHKLNHKFTAFWTKIATVFKGNPYVIAYEIINQPFIGDFIRNPLLVIPSVAERVKFQNFYDRISRSIREVDPNTPLCIQPITFDNTIPVGFSHAPGGKKYSNLSILCYHYYKPPALGPSTMYSRIKDGKRLKIASLLSEFEGASLANNEIITIAEDNLQSWLFWDFKDFGKNWGSTRSKYPTLNQDEEPILGSFFNNDGTPNRPVLEMLSRTYLQRTWGRLERSSYDHTTKYFNALFTARPGGASVLFINKQINYPNGYSLEITPRDNVSIREDQNYIEIQSLSKQEQFVMVTVRKL